MLNKSDIAINLKSNMDRFIAKRITTHIKLHIYLKSNMDRFIESH